MAHFILLLRDDPSAFQDLSPEEMQAIIAKYSAWRDRLRESGRLMASDKLTDGEGRVIAAKNGKVRVIDGPYSETKEVIGGFFVVQADDYDEAVKLCEDCPHVEREGTIEIREVEPTG